MSSEPRLRPANSPRPARARHRRARPSRRDLVLQRRRSRYRHQGALLPSLPSFPPADTRRGSKRMRDAGAQITTSESILFQIMRSSPPPPPFPLFSERGTDTYETSRRRCPSWIQSDGGTGEGAQGDDEGCVGEAYCGQGVLGEPTGVERSLETVYCLHESILSRRRAWSEPKS